MVSQLQTLLFPQVLRPLPLSTGMPGRCRLLSEGGGQGGGCSWSHGAVLQ